ncbi:MAG: DUF87 domain-containing protein [Acidimicrobiia bacterium]|nr:DUF87 domain-containing protein [Acidimicrobiia bacterium]
MSEGFYLGGIVDPKSGERADELLHYDGSDLTTHGVIVGMTGSGKTGLGVIFLEEALRDGVPTLILDPKGDMTNLLLNFPDLLPADFEPWIDEGVARKEGKSTAEMAEGMADLWKNGLAGWDLGPDQMRSLKDGTDFTVYTPGSEAGVPVNIVGSLSAPDLDWGEHSETLADEIEGFVSGLLGLAGIESDPLSSREHILISNLMAHAWQNGKDLDLASLIGQVQMPPIRKLGVFDVDTFFPEKDRLALAMKLNGLVASPAFASWMAGPALDIQSMLWNEDGKPQAAILYLAHLSEEERQFVVTLALSKVVTWMRTQSGSGELRALIYMDEVFGFVPPSAKPPAKKPILTILKQARAFGVGLLLSTQNPVDLDYKAMSNAGTWCIGRLQTERDKARILEGMQSATGAVDTKAMDETISGLDKRQFILHSTHEKEPSLFTTRWAMSYLRGPLTKDQVGQLTEGTAAKKKANEATAAAAEASPAPAELADDESPMAPKVHSSVPAYYLDPAAPWASEIGADTESTTYAPALAARVLLVFDETAADLNHQEEWEAIYFPLGAHFDVDTAVAVDYDDRDLRPQPPAEASYRLGDAPLDKSAYFTAAKKEIADTLYRQRTVTIHRNKALKMYSRIGESEEDFGKRCDLAADDKADAEIAKLKDKLKTKLDRLRDQVQAAELRLAELQTDVSSRRQEEILDGIGGLLGGILSGRKNRRGVGRAVSKRSRTKSTEQRKSTAATKLADKIADLEEAETDAVLDIEEVNDRWDDVATEIEEVEVGLEKTDVKVGDLAVVWIPVS